MALSRVEQLAAIRRDSRLQGLSVWALAQEVRRAPPHRARGVVPLDTFCDAYGLAEEVIGDPAGAAASGTPA